MSVKIKINWDNENVVSESVQIYRADSAFTKENLPPVLTEIIGDAHEDLTTVEGRTYFYMLSAKLGEQEAFTECFEVVAVLNQSFEKIVSFGASTTLLLNSDSQCSFYSEDGLYLYQVLTNLSSFNLIHTKYECITPFGVVNPSRLNSYNLPVGLSSGSVSMLAFFDDGKGCAVSVYVSSSSSKLVILQLTTAYDLSTAVVKSAVDRNVRIKVFISNNKKHLIEVISNGIFKIQDIYGDIYSTYTLSAGVSYTIAEITTSSIYTLAIAHDGKSMLIVAGNGNTSQVKRIISIKTETPYDFSTYTAHVMDRGSARELVRLNATNRFVYTEQNFLLLHVVDTNHLTKQDVTFERW